MTMSLPPQDRIQKILIVGHSNIGDIATDSLFLKPLRRAYPKAQIHFMTSPRARELLSCYKGIDREIILDKRGEHKGFWGRIKFHRELAREKYDLMIVLVKTYMHIFLRPPYVWDVRRICADDYKNKSIHPLDVYMKFMRQVGLPIEKIEFDFNLQGEEAFCEKFLSDRGVKREDVIVGILPLAAWGLKNWPIKKWNALAAELKASGIKTIAFGKTSGDFVGQEVLDHISPQIISAIDKLSLKQTVALIERCRIFIGPDSSLLHLASNLNVETIGLYGPTPPDYVYPYFHRNNLIIAKPVPAKYTCFKDPYSCVCKSEPMPSPCMDSITVEEVLKALLGKII